MTRRLGSPSPNVVIRLDVDYKCKRSAKDANSPLARSQVDANLVARADCLARSAQTWGPAVARGVWRVMGDLDCLVSGALRAYATIGGVDVLV